MKAQILTQTLTLDFEENSLFQEGVISEGYQRPDTSHSFKNLKN